MQHLLVGKLRVAASLLWTFIYFPADEIIQFKPLKDTSVTAFMSADTPWCEAFILEGKRNSVKSFFFFLIKLSFHNLPSRWHCGNIFILHSCQNSEASRYL